MLADCPSTTSCSDQSLQDGRLARDNEAIKTSLKLYDEALERFIPVLMGMAKIYWDRGNYTQVRTFRSIPLGAA